MRYILIIALLLFYLMTYGQSQNFNNGNLENVNAVWINDPGPEEGIKWQQTSANWSIDVSPEDRTNVDGNLNIYGTSNSIVLWRPVVLKNSIGIGLSDPEAKFHVYNSTHLGTAAGSNILLSRFEGRTGNYFNISTWLLRDSYGSNWLTARYHNGISIDASYFEPGINTRTWWERDPYNNIQSWGNSNSTYLTIKSGNVGIGETNPSKKLVVNGVIGATEVRVSSTPNSDYVFEPDYDLKSLKEVESFIQQNKHLPDIPSAEEFKENGVGLGEMDDMLLRKIEELTLYMIELKKENEELKISSQELKEENQSLKTNLLKEIETIKALLK